MERTRPGLSVFAIFVVGSVVAVALLTWYVRSGELGSMAIEPSDLTPNLTPEDARPFSDDGPWNAPIPNQPLLDDNSSAIVDLLASSGYGTANLYEFGIPIYDADATTPRHNVSCERPGWGTCDIEDGPVPIPAGARPHPGSDGAMVVIDWEARRSYGYFKAARTADGSWRAVWGDITDIDGRGVAKGASTGAGVPRLAGVIRTFEIAAGTIDHALVFSTDVACVEQYRAPATKTDGTSELADCIPQGARIQLDPDVDLDALANLSAGERAVAEALQTYGAYAIDNGGASMAFSFEHPMGGPDPYAAAGLVADYQSMEAIPWERLRVLRQWDGR